MAERRGALPDTPDRARSPDKDAVTEGCALSGFSTSKRNCGLTGRREFKVDGENKGCEEGPGAIW